MKKLMILALAAITASTAFAQGDALKSILKSKSYEEAESLLNSNLSSFSAEQKAKAYNKLVDLAMKKFQDEASIESTNQVKQQMQQSGVEPYDTLGYYQAAYNAVKNGMECEKYDIQPNEKGKVAPKFHDANQARLKNARLNLINAGQYFGGKDDSKNALSNYAMYVESASNSLFSNTKGEKEYDQWLGEVARVAAVYSFQEKDFDNANKYCDVSLADTASHKDALGLKMYILQQNLTTHEDSIATLARIEKVYETEKDEQVFNSLVNMYGSLGMSDKQLEFINSRLAIDPNNFTVWALKGENEMNAGKLDDALADFKKALSINSERALLYTYIGYVYTSKASQLNSVEEQKAMIKEAVPYLEKAKELDPDRKETNWSYPLYQVYYNLYGPDDAKTKEIEALVK